MLFKFHKRFHFKGSSQDVRNLMRNSGYLEKHKNDQLKFKANKSYGTLMIKSAPDFLDGIFLKVKLEEKDVNNTIIEFKAPLRFDHFFYAILFILFLLGESYSQDNNNHIGLIFILSLWPLTHLWFHFVFRFQEKWLMESVTDDIRCTKI